MFLKLIFPLVEITEYSGGVQKGSTQGERGQVNWKVENKRNWMRVEEIGGTDEEKKKKTRSGQKRR